MPQIKHFFLQSVYGVVLLHNLVCQAANLLPAYALTSQTIPLIRPCSICSTHGGNKPPSWNRARLPKRNKTSGGTSTRNWTPQSIGLKFPHRRSVICLWKNYRKSRKKKRKIEKEESIKKTLPIFSFHI